MGMMDYDHEWKEQRKLARNVLGFGSVKKFYRIQEDVAVLLARDLIDDPNNYASSLRS